jgi:hypothetical protein
MCAFGKICLLQVGYIYSLLLFLCKIDTGCVFFDGCIVI